MDGEVTKATEEPREVRAEELVSTDWRVDSRIYRDPGLFRRELVEIFHKTWLYLGHESEIANKGDYKTTYAAGQPVIVTRGADDGEVHALLNRCRHRGSIVCQAGSGSANFFRCPYHGWTYHNDGRLRGVTYEGAYAELPKEELGLVKLPRLESYRGFIFGSLSPEGPSLREHLGEARKYIDRVIDLHPEGIELVAGAHRVRFDGNWKLQVENSIDNYHFAFVHRSYIDLMIKSNGEPPSVASDVYRNPDWCTRDLGGGHAVAEFGNPDERNDFAGIGDLPFNLIVFPNLVLIGSHVRVVHPRGVEDTEVVFYPIFGVNEDAANDAALSRHEAFYGPSGFGATDDVEVAFSRTKDGMRAVEEDWVWFGRGSTTEVEEDDGTRTGHAADEVAQRAFYREWMRCLEGSV